MSQAIHCPGCNKKYSLPENPPATFTCRQCDTLMDLSDFGGRDRPAKPTRAKAGGPPRSRRQRAKGGGAPAPARGRGRGGRAAAPAPSRGGGRARGGRSRRGAPDDHDDGGGRRGRARQENNNALIIGAAVALVVVVALVVIILGSKDDTPVESTDAAKGATKDRPKALTGLSGDGTDDSGSPAPAGDAPTGDAPAGDASKGASPAPSGDEPTGDAPTPEDPPKKRKPVRNPRIGSMKLAIHDWPEEVDAETRAQVDEAIPALYRGGRDALEAREFLESKGRPIAGRLISEFKRIDENPGFDDKEGASRAGVIDSVLRAIDGWQERRFKEEAQVRVTSTPSFTMRIAKRWTAWWVSDEWKTNPRDPWDPFVDSFDDPEPSKKKSKGTGFTKRAGG